MQFGFPPRKNCRQLPANRQPSRNADEYDLRVGVVWNIPATVAGGPTTPCCRNQTCPTERHLPNAPLFPDATSSITDADEECQRLAEELRPIASCKQAGKPPLSPTRLAAKLSLPTQGRAGGSRRNVIAATMRTNDVSLRARRTGAGPCNEPAERRGARPAGTWRSSRCGGEPSGVRRASP